MENYIGNQDSLTLHIRITKKCNADCSYCSSFESKASKRMSLEELNTSLDFLVSFIKNNKLGGTRKMLSVQYVGGELTTLPKEYLSSFCAMVEEKLSGLFQEFQHGGQSNLIASKDKVEHLIEIFGGNIGTSIDNFTDQRTIKQSANKYRTIFIENLTHAKKLIGKYFSSIIVLDEKMKPYIHEEIKIAEQKNMHITLRPVFNGGMSVDNVETNSLTETYNEIFDNWFMKSNIILEPHFSLLQKRFLKYKNSINLLPTYSGCPFQSNCATSSLNLEPNGDLYVCLDMADSKHYPFGNALTGEINNEIFDMLISRTEKLNSDCKQCDYFNECQGGCMNEAIEHTGDVFGKTQYCSTWKNLFSRIDIGIEKNGVDNVQSWIDSLNTHK